MSYGGIHGKAMTMILGALALGMDLPTIKMPKKNEPRKCALPECETLTDHNGGYCCAEHCREHKRRTNSK